MSNVDRCPVNVVTGFLGAGKTTLLNHLLAHPDLADTAVIINEFGDTALDHWLVEGGSEEIVTLGQGCICCSLRGDLVATLRGLFRQAANGEIPRFRRILIETTGLADPAPVVQTLIQDPLLAFETRLGGIVTLVDAVHGEETLTAHAEARRQAAMADRIVISKGDIVTAAQEQSVVTALRDAGVRAPVTSTADGRPHPDDILLTGTSSTDGAQLRRWLQLDGLTPVGGAGNASGTSGLIGGGRNHHEPGDTAHGAIESVVLNHAGALTPQDLDAFLDTLCELQGHRLLRLKGVVKLTDDPARPAVIHAVRGLRYPPGRLPAWPPGVADTALVCIGEGLDMDRVRSLWDYAVSRG